MDCSTSENIVEITAIRQARLLSAMKTVLFVIGILINSALYALNNNIIPNAKVLDDTSVLLIPNLPIGDSIKYKMYLTSCLSGDLYSTMDSISFYRDSVTMKALYMGKSYIIDEGKLIELGIIENNILAIGTTNSTSYYNYIISYHGEEGLLGFGEKNLWDELIMFIKNKCR